MCSFMLQPIEMETWATFLFKGTTGELVDNGNASAATYPKCASDRVEAIWTAATLDGLLKAWRKEPSVMKDAVHIKQHMNELFWVPSFVGPSARQVTLRTFDRIGFRKRQRDDLL